MSTTPSGTISASSVRTALNVTNSAGGTTNYPTNLISFNDSLVRVLASKVTGAISMNDMRNKAGPDAYGTAYDAGACGIVASTTFSQTFNNGTYGTYRVDTPSSSLCETMPSSLNSYASIVTSPYPYVAYNISKSYAITAIPASGIAAFAGQYGSISFSGGGSFTYASKPAGLETVMPVIYGNPRILAALKYTTSGTSLSTIASSDPSFNPRGMVYGPAGYLLSTGTASVKTCYISSNGVSWSGYSGAPGIFRTLTASSTNYFAIYFNTTSWPQNIYKSTNGQSWSVAGSVTLGPTAPYGSGSVAMAYGAGKLVVVGASWDDNTIKVGVSSDDGASWTVTSLTSPFASNNKTGGSAIVYCGNGTFVIAVTGGSFKTAISRSTDKGVTWSTPTTSDIASDWVPDPVMFADTSGRVVYQGYFVSSDYGATWTKITLTGTYGMLAPIYG